MKRFRKLKKLVIFSKNVLVFWEVHDFTLVRISLHVCSYSPLRTFRGGLARSHSSLFLESESEKLSHGIPMDRRLQYLLCVKADCINFADRQLSFTGITSSFLQKNWNFSECIAIFDRKTQDLFSRSFMVLGNFYWPLLRSYRRL